MSGPCNFFFSRNVSLSFYMHIIHSVQLAFTKSWIFISEKSGPEFFLFVFFVCFFVCVFFV